ncbi:MAG: hypothetical protein ACEQSU_14875 [Microgenomates group bacterium]
MTLVSDSNIVNSLRAAQSGRNFQKASATSKGAGTFLSLWKTAGLPAAGANPPLFSAGSGYIPTKATTGAYPFTNSATNGHLALLRAGYFGVTPHTLIIYDRLWACSGFGTVITTAQTVTTPGTLTAGRDPNNGLDVEPFLEVYTAPGATAATWTVTGTDALGNTGVTWTYAHPASAEAIGQMVPLTPGTASSLGMRIASSFTASATSGTAGDVGITLMRRVAEIPVLAANLGDVQDALRLGLPPIYNDACIALGLLCTASPTGLLMGSIVIGEGA